MFSRAVITEDNIDLKHEFVRLPFTIIVRLHYIQKLFPIFA